MPVTPERLAEMYERLSLRLKHGTRAKLQSVAMKSGVSETRFIEQLIDDKYELSGLPDTEKLSISDVFREFREFNIEAPRMRQPVRRATFLWLAKMSESIGVKIFDSPKGIRINYSAPISEGNAQVHRSVMAKALGRDLTQHEIVHHMDGDTANNSHDNLIVVSHARHQEIHHAIARYLKEQGTV